MTLSDIERILRPQFTFEKEQHRRWHVATETSAGIGDQATIALIVFCGIAYQNGFKDTDVFHHLGIHRRKHTIYLAKFKKALNEVEMGEISSLYKDDSSFSEKIIRKARLVENAIKINFPKGFITLADVGY